MNKKPSRHIQVGSVLSLTNSRDKDCKELITTSTGACHSNGKVSSKIWIPNGTGLAAPQYRVLLEMKIFHFLDRQNPYCTHIQSTETSLELEIGQKPNTCMSWGCR